MQKIGEIVAYREKGTLRLGTILEDKNKKVVILSEDNKRNNISPDKIEIELDKMLSLTKKDHEIAKEIKKIKEQIEELSRQINLQDLYDLLQEEDTGYSYQLLSEYYFPETSVEHFIAMVLALADDTLYFKQKNNLYYTKPQKAVQEQIKEIERKKLNEQKKREDKEKAINWLKGFITSPSKESPPSEVVKYLDPIRQYIIFRDQYERKDSALNTYEELQSEVHFKESDSKIENMYRLFIHLNIFKEDENLFLHKYSLPIHFQDKDIKEAEQVTAFTERDLDNRIDLRSQYTITIDDADTQDIDDAITFDETESGYNVGVHIIDVSHFIPPDSSLDKEALNRGTTIYLPLEKISMFPPILSDNKMSLLEGEQRPVITFSYHFDKEFQLISNDISLSTIQIDKNMTYNEVDELISQDTPESKPFKTMYQIAKKLNEKRDREGALDFNSPDVKIKLTEEGTIYLKEVNQGLKSEIIVKELMILVNHTAATFCQINQIPIIYITQDPPDENFKITDKIRKNKPQLIELLKKMKKSEIELYPRKHSGLGLSAYTQASSPIRRYHDLVVHRQIKSFLHNKKPYYNIDKIQIIAATAEKAIKEVRTIERETIRYWLLKYLKQEKKRAFKAIVIKILNNSYLVEIQEVYIQALLITPANLKINQVIDISIERVNPFLDTLSIRRITN